ncbi:hypothetical protein [uncultured Fluviicola sp.]|uniref:toxin-antitoxin system YwqK family antitoxin n=1 Tax=uncultured Fluviicola sp. TaxID=463303 RepID=UPI0025E51EB2|nr:hypothetical protein [uncultured Fluviicola sp.]
MPLVRFYSFLLFLFAVHFNVTAQSSCLYFGKLQVESTTWKEGEIAITRFLVNNTDSVVFSENGKTFGSFLAKNEQVVSPCIVIRDLQDRIRSVDSVRPYTYYEKTVNYFGYWVVPVVKWEYGVNGIPSKMTLKNKQGRDSLVREWDLHGVLQKEQVEGLYPQTCYYYTNGVLKSVTKDTFINRYNVKRVRNYSENGIIQQESWFRNDVPCKNWLIYDGNGVLNKTIKHAPLPEKSAVPYAVDMEPPVLMLVSEQADPAGGQTAFFRYLESSLERELCKRYFSGNTYVLRFEIQEDGTCVYKSLQGPDTFETEPFFKAAIEASPRWVPAKRQGTPGRETISLSVRIG